MTTLAAPSLRPMTEDDLDWVVVAEALLHAFPWTRGNFADSLAAGYRCFILQSENRRIAYAVVLHVLDEAHLLNISVVASAQRGGAGSLLLEHLRAQALLQGARHFFLEVRPSNEAAIALHCEPEDSQLRPVDWPSTTSRRKRRTRSSDGLPPPSTVTRIQLRSAPLTGRQYVEVAGQTTAWLPAEQPIRATGQSFPLLTARPRLALQAAQEAT